MTEDDRTEILAQALYLQTFGIMNLQPQWSEFAINNPAAADAYRTKAEAMMQVAGAVSVHSLGWLYG